MCCISNSVSLYISLGSFLVAAAALLLHFNKYRGEKTQSRKAIVRAIGFESNYNSIVGMQPYWGIRIWNDGESTAKNIRLESKDIGDEKAIRLLCEDDKFPYPLLNKGDKFEFSIDVQSKPSSNIILKFIWDDEYKKNNEREQILEF